MKNIPKPILVTVNRNLSEYEVYEAAKTVRRLYFAIPSNIWMPSGGTGIETVTVEFFLPKETSTGIDKLNREYKEHGLVPDPYAVAAVNQTYPDFANEYPNGTYWKFVHWYAIRYYNHLAQRAMGLVGADGWDTKFWCGGIRK